MFRYRKSGKWQRHNIAVLITSFFDNRSPEKLTTSLQQTHSVLRTIGGIFKQPLRSGHFLILDSGQDSNAYWHFYKMPLNDWHFGNHTLKNCITRAPCQHTTARKHLSFATFRCMAYRYLLMYVCSHYIQVLTQVLWVYYLPISSFRAWLLWIWWSDWPVSGVYYGVCMNPPNPPCVRAWNA